MSERVVGYRTPFNATDENIEDQLAADWWLYGTPFIQQQAIVQIMVKYDSASEKGPIKTPRGRGAGGQPRGRGGR